MICEFGVVVEQRFQLICLHHYVWVVNVCRYTLAWMLHLYHYFHEVRVVYTGTNAHNIGSREQTAQMVC